MVRPVTSLARAARWQQLLAIIVVLSSMLTTSAPAVPDDPPPDCVNVFSLLADPQAQGVETIGTGEKIIHLKSASGTNVLTLCPPLASDPPVYGARFKVRESNVQLDCGGVVFDGRPFHRVEGVAFPNEVFLDPDGSPQDWDEDWYKRRGAGNPEYWDAFWAGAVGWALNFETELSTGIQDVVVRNCEFQNYPEGIKVTGASIEENGLDLGLKNITLQDIGLSKIWATAVYVGVDNRDNLLERVTVTAARTGVYLEAYSSRTTIRDCYFAENGWSGTAAGDGREAIAIDGSSHNVITDSTFIHNKYAGIALYKNCGEAGDPREVGANYNVIERNEFYKHDKGAIDINTGLIRGGAIVIASRQGLDFEDGQDAWGDATCTDLPAHGDLYRDIARYNVVRNNAFAFNLNAIRVRDSFNHVEGNTFMGNTWENDDDGELDDHLDGEDEPRNPKQAQYDVLVDAQLLDRMLVPGIGITVVDNVTLTIPHNPDGDKASEADPDRPFRARFGGPMLFANNVDRYYQCVPDSLAPGNRCNVKPPLNRCEVTGIPVGCPSRDQMTTLPDAPDTWLATLYGANILPDVCEERAKAIWEYCAEELQTDDFEIKTAAVVDGYYDNSRKWSCAVADCQTSPP